MALEGRVDQDLIKSLEKAALAAVRGFAERQASLDQALDGVMAYWAELNWEAEASVAKHQMAVERQRLVYARTLGDRPWESCSCRACRESGIEVVMFRSSNRNKRRGIHNLKVFHDHLRTHRAAPRHRP